MTGGIEVPPPKGAKVWALLAYLAVSPRPRQRAELAELLFADAADPLGALRWNLAAMRRLLDRPDAFKGDVLCFDANAVKVDAIELDRATTLPPRGEAGRQQLLAGLSFPDSPLFELWLTTERHRLRRRCCSLLREAALDAFARGDLTVFIELATDLVATEPHDEGHHALLIRALALDGRTTAAREQFDRSRAFIRSELGCEPGAAVLAAAHLPSQRIATARPDEGEIWGHLNVAWQSFLAGSIDHALDLGRNSVLLADQSSEVVLRITSRLYVAAMLNMSVRGWDEAVITTAAATHLASDAGLASFEAIARGVVAGSELMRGDYRIAVDQATTGIELADDPDSRALNFAFLAAAESDTGQHEAARRHAAQAVECAELSTDPIRHAYAYAYAAYADLATHNDTSARGFARRAIDACASILVLKPWPMALLAELELRNGDLSRRSRPGAGGRWTGCDNGHALPTGAGATSTRARRCTYRRLRRGVGTSGDCARPRPPHRRAGVSVPLADRLDARIVGGSQRAIPTSGRLALGARSARALRGDPSASLISARHSPARRVRDRVIDIQGMNSQKTTYASPTTATPTTDAMTATEVIRLACSSSHSFPSDTSRCRATARRRSHTIPRIRHPTRVATPKNTSAGTISRRAPQPAEFASSSDQPTSSSASSCGRRVKAGDHGCQLGGAAEPTVDQDERRHRGLLSGRVLEYVGWRQRHNRRLEVTTASMGWSGTRGPAPVVGSPVRTIPITSHKEVSL